MSKSENTSLLLIGAAGFIAYLMMKKKATAAQNAKAGAIPRDIWGGGLSSVIPDVIVDYFSGRSVSQVLAAPGPAFQREVLDYRQEGGNYPTPQSAADSSIWENFFSPGTWSSPVRPQGEGG